MKKYLFFQLSVVVFWFFFVVLFGCVWVGYGFWCFGVGCGKASPYRGMVYIIDDCNG